MKRLLRIFSLLVLIASIYVILTSCGKKEETNREDNKGQSNNNIPSVVENILVATKNTNELGMEIKETVEIKFEADKANEVEYTLEFESEVAASDYHQAVSILLLDEDTPDFSMMLKDKKVIFSMPAENFLDMWGFLEKQSKNEIREELQGLGYSIR